MDADRHQCPAPRFTSAAVRGTFVQEIPEGSREPVSEFCRPRPDPIIQTLKIDLNRFNQTVVSYDASKEEKVDALKKKNVATEQRLRDRQSD